jgi:hypothetical protein
MKTYQMMNTSESGLKKNFLDLNGLIRSIQRPESLADHSCKEQEFCGRILCAWRPYCLENIQEAFY